MEFCSEFGYNYGHEGSDEEEYNDEDEQSKQIIKRRIRKADTNIIAVKFDELVAPNLMFAGEPKACPKCAAFMSVESEKNIEKTEGKLLWKCEFCYELNDMSALIEDINEIPKKNDVTFMLEMPKSKLEELKTGEIKSTSLDDSYLTYCIDISGSMSGAIPVKQNEDSSIINRNLYVSRLQGVQAACVQNLKLLKDSTPEKNVSLVTFSDTVKYYGDTTKLTERNPILQFEGSQYKSDGSVITGNVASNQIAEDQNDNANADGKRQILNLAHNADGNLEKVSKTFESLENRIKSLRTEGCTALGPALLFSVAFSSKKLGSSVILCTDGCANVGMGSIEKEEAQVSEKFYDDIADYAKEKGVTVNVISMEGTDCKLSILGRVTDRSNGVLSVVNPLNLGDELKSILENRIVATNVQAKLIVNNKYLYIRDETIEEEESKAIASDDAAAKEALNLQRKSTIVKDIGNANVDTEMTFEYGFRKLDKNDEIPKTITELPFQLQITYTTPDGAKALRVYTLKQKFTTNREEAERSLKSKDLVYTTCMQKMSYHMLKSNITAGKYKDYAQEQMFSRNAYGPVPEMYANQSKAVKDNPKSYKFESCDDKMASECYTNNKMSRMKMNKKK